MARGRWPESECMCNYSHRPVKPRRLSVQDLPLPKFSMHLAAHQGNPRVLSSLLADRRSTARRFRHPSEYATLESEGTTLESEETTLESDGTTLESEETTLESEGTKW